MLKRKLNQAAYVALACLFLSPTLAVAGPTGGNVVKGDANIDYNGNTTNINQNSDRATINWDGFSVAPNETVNFNQPNSNAMTLNRVIGNERSVIEGAINANGKVYLVNSNGVLFTGSSTVNVGGLVASSLNITDDDFMNGNFTFQSDKDKPASVINQGEIMINAAGGYVALMGGEVYNEGLIVASMGTVSLNSGKKVTLNFQGDSLISATIDEAALDALVVNKEAIIADGGVIIMTAKAAGDVLSAQVKNEGTVQARTISDLNGGYSEGEIYLYAYGGTTEVGGTLDASAREGGNGGFIETSGDTVNINDSAAISTYAANGKGGTWLIDPTDFTIAAEGKGGNMTGKQVSDYLNQNDDSDFIIASEKSGNSGKGDINVNDDISWDSDSDLTLNAYNDVNVNATITANGDNANLIMNAGVDNTVGDININNAITLAGTNTGLVMTFKGDYNILTKASYSGAEVVDPTTGAAGAGNSVAKEDTRDDKVYGSIAFTNEANTKGLTINGQEYTLLYDINDFNSVIGADLNGHYALAKNIAGGTHADNVVAGEFTGTFAGLGNAIDGLTLNGSGNNTGLFAVTGDGVFIRDIGLTNVSISNPSGSSGRTGALIGYAKGSGNVYQAYVEGGSVTGYGYTGGLIGQAEVANVSDVFNIRSSYAAVTVTARTNVGGLLGGVSANTTCGIVNIYSSHATGNVTATGTSGAAGGLVGRVTGDVDACYASGNITASTSNTGGLIGNYSTSNGHTINLTNSFATGDLGSDKSNLRQPSAGGLVGIMQTYDDGGTIYVYNSYAEGDVYGGTRGAANGGYGGLVGYAKGSVFFSYVHAKGHITAESIGSGAGGLIGFLEARPENMDKTTVGFAYATGNVTITGASQLNVGGLIGNAHYTNITDSYAEGNVQGDLHVGGLVGSLQYGGSINNSYAKGSVKAKEIAGGLVGWAYGSFYGDNASISNSWASGSVYVNGNEGRGQAGGLVGRGSDLIIIDSKGSSSVSGAPGLSDVGGGLVGFDSGAGYGHGVTVIDNAAIARAANERQQTINNTNSVSNVVASSTEEMSDRVAESASVAETSPSQETVAGLPGNTGGSGEASSGSGSGSGSGWGWGSGEGGEPITMAMLGANVFSAQVRTIMTDEGDVYDLEEAEQ